MGERHMRASMMQTLTEVFFVLLCGGVLYFGIEVLWRGYSHWSMSLCGGLCFLLLYRMNRRYPRVPLAIRAVAGGVMITATELIFGCLFNLGLGMEIWNYSQLPYHFLGQICLLYSALWVLLCFPAAYLCYLIRRFVFLSEE